MQPWKKIQIAFLVVALLAPSSVAIAVFAQESVAASSVPGKKTHPSGHHAASSSNSTHSTHSKSSTSGKKGTSAARKRSSVRPTPQSIKLTIAFHATEQLRPMAQQLAATRSVAAYNGVLNYARVHPGEAAATAYLALGHAYMLDRRYSDALDMYRRAAIAGKALDDYADYLGAQAALQAGRGTDAYALLDRFAERHPDSIFVANAPVLLANAHLQQNNPQGATKVLEPLAGTAQAEHSDFQYALGRSYQLAGDTTRASSIYRNLYVKMPLSFEAGQAKQQLDAMGMPLSAAERKVHADQLFNAKRYNDAGAEYHSIAHSDPSLSQADRDALAIYTAVCDMKMKRISRHDVEQLPTTADDTAALKLYMLAEISRSEGDRAGHDAIIQQMIQRFPTSRWLEEALYSGGNMYLLKHDPEQATFHYAKLVEMFPTSTYAPSAHWRAAWMNYRLRNYAEAARLFDEQIQRYPGGIEIPGALYWRGRIYEDEEHSLSQAANYYHVLASTFVNYYYADLARKRLSVLGSQSTSPYTAALNAVHPSAPPDLTSELPENEPHLIKARLLANAALNEYIGPEIQASPTSSEWGALAQAQIYNSYGETARSLQSMKHSGIPFFSLALNQAPPIYWQLLLPRPYWQDVVSHSGRNGLDPYLVASLIRQESEFNPGAVSRANAYGLMQVLPSVGKSLSKRQGIRGFKASELLNPSVNVQLGTVYLRQTIDRFDGQLEYALAAYNAGDVPVRQWISENNYKDMAEFVESIPYTETREYVQAILRNRQVYRAFYSQR